MSAVVNKQGLATLLGISLPTLSRWMLRYGVDFPTLERGTLGREFKFEDAAVIAFLRTKQEEQASSKAEQDEQLAQLLLPFDLPGVEPPPKATSPKDELAAWELRKRQRIEAEASGKLVPAEPMADAIRTVLARISRDTHAFVRQVGREQGWPDSFTRELEKRLADQQRAAVASLREMLGGVSSENTDAAD